MIRSYDGPFQEREGIFHGVCVDFAFNVLAPAVPNLGVLRIAEFRDSEILGPGIIRHDCFRPIRVNVFCNGFIERASLVVPDVYEPKGTAALPDS